MPLANTLGISPLGGRPYSVLPSRVRFVAECGIVEKDRCPEEVAVERVEGVVVSGDRARHTPESIKVRDVVQRETGKAVNYP